MLNIPESEHSTSASSSLTNQELSSVMNPDALVTTFGVFDTTHIGVILGLKPNDIPGKNLWKANIQTFFNALKKPHAEVCVVVRKLGPNHLFVDKQSKIIVRFPNNKPPQKEISVHLFQKILADITQIPRNELQDSNRHTTVYNNFLSVGIKMINITKDGHRVL